MKSHSALLPERSATDRFDGAAKSGAEDRSARFRRKTMPVIRCLVAAASPETSGVLKRRLSELPWPKVLAESAGVLEIQGAIKFYEPEVLVLEIDDAGIDPLSETKAVRSAHPKLPVLICSSQTDAILASRLLRSGAQGYLLNEDWENIGRALALLKGGSRYVSERLMQEILQHLGDFEDTLEGAELLSDRELIVFQFLGMGHNPVRIAIELNVSTKTVATHQANIKRKMHLANNTALRASARRWISQRSEKL